MGNVDSSIPIPWRKSTEKRRDDLSIWRTALVLWRVTTYHRLLFGSTDVSQRWRRSGNVRHYYVWAAIYPSIISHVYTPGAVFYNFDFGNISECLCRKIERYEPFLRTCENGTRHLCTMDTSVIGNITLRRELEKGLDQIPLSQPRASNFTQELLSVWKCVCTLLKWNDKFSSETMAMGKDVVLTAIRVEKEYVPGWLKRLATVH